jgi:hypothetical protein
MLALKTEHLFDSRATVKPFSEWMVVGDGGWGFRLIVPVAEGTVEGPKIKGVVGDLGADWGVLRHDNVLVVDARCVLETGYEKYQWLNKIKAVAIGEVNQEKDPPEVRYSVYALR